MKGTPKQRIIWAKRNDVETVPDSTLRERVGVEDSAVEVETKTVGRWGNAAIPTGSRDESGSVLPLMNVGYEVLPPEGRVYLVDLE